MVEVVVALEDDVVVDVDVVPLKDLMAVADVLPPLPRVSVFDLNADDDDDAVWECALLLLLLLLLLVRFMPNIAVLVVEAGRW